MTDESLIEVTRAGDHDHLRSLLEKGADVHERDEQGWTPLNHASGRGDLESVRLLLDHGADPSLAGRDNRTPLMIAKAADRQEVVKALEEAEKERGVWIDPRESRQYARAYYLRDLRRFDNWSERPGEDPEAGLEEDTVVYLHQDFTVTRSMWHGEDVIFLGETPGWQEFCRQDLEFDLPDDLI